MKLETQAEDKELDRRRIPNARNYEIDSDGFEYRKGNSLQLRRQGSRWKAEVYDHDESHNNRD